MTAEQSRRLLARAVAYRPIVLPDARPGHWLVQSESDAGHFYRVNGSCDCEAGRQGRPCKHRICVAAIAKGVLDYGTWTIVA